MVLFLFFVALERESCFWCVFFLPCVFLCVLVFLFFGGSCLYVLVLVLFPAVFTARDLGGRGLPLALVLKLGRARFGLQASNELRAGPFYA